MADDGLEQLAAQIRKYIEFARRVMRRWWVVAICFVVGAAASITVAFMMTRVYQSRTLIAWKESVNKQQVFRNEQITQEENYLTTRLEETFSSHTLLMRIIRDMDLFPSMRDSVAPEVLLKEAREKIDYGIVGSDSFWIAFEYKDPRRAQLVTTRLAEEFINKNLSDKLRAAQTTLSFMQREVKKTKTEIDRIEGEIAEFVSDHPEYQIDPATGMPRGLVTTSPTGGAADAARLARVSDPKLRAALARKGRLQAQLQLILNPQSDSQLVQARQTVQRARQRLAALRRKYTDRHPDVQRARNYLRQAQMQLTSAQSSRKGSQAGVSQLRDQLAEVEQTIARLSRARRAVAAKAAPEEPRRERGLSAKAKLEKRWYQLTRDREVARAKYEQLEERLLRSKVAASLERKQAESQFSVVDKANLPRKPIRPSRTKLTLAGTAMGTMLGFGLAVLLVLFDPRVYSEDDLKKVTDLPVLAHIPKQS